jgi:hypothetical protein
MWIGEYSAIRAWIGCSLSLRYIRKTFMSAIDKRTSLLLKRLKIVMCTQREYFLSYSILFRTKLEPLTGANNYILDLKKCRLGQGATTLIITTFSIVIQPIDIQHNNKLNMTLSIMALSIIVECYYAERRLC